MFEIHIGQTLELATVVNRKLIRSIHLITNEVNKFIITSLQKKSDLYRMWHLRFNL